MLVNIPFAVFILFPLSIQRDMSSLRYAGVASVAALSYTLLVLGIEMPFYYSENIVKEETQVHAFILDLNIFSSMSIVFFAFTCQMNLLPIYSELVNPDYRRIKKVVHRALLLDCIFYLIIASTGYFSTFNMT